MIIQKKNINKKILAVLVLILFQSIVLFNFERVSAAALSIIGQPKSVAVELGKTAVFSVKAEGTGLTYEWQARDPKDTKWYTMSSKTSTYSTELSQSSNGRQVRCIVRDAAGNEVTSEIATMKMAAELKITEQPKNVAVGLGKTAVFSVKAEGTGLTYEWQARDPKDTKWYTMSSKTSTYSTELSRSNNGRQVRCIVRDVAGNEVTSEVAKMVIINKEEWELPIQ